MGTARCGIGGRDLLPGPIPVVDQRRARARPPPRAHLATARGHRRRVLGRDLDALHALLSRWGLHVAAAGHLTPWHGEPLDLARHQNNVWCRRTPIRPRLLEVTIGEGSDDNWIHRGRPSVVVPWNMAVLHTTEGIPYLAPELQLLYKSKSPRSKDEADAAEVIPSLDPRQRVVLARLLEPDHPWHHLLA